MGNIRDKPDKTKNTEVFRHKKVTYVQSSMCGWRQYMEDVIMSIYPFCNNEDMGLFGIFDGHGGPQCSQFAGKYFPQILKGNENFKAKNYQDALTETFLKIDQLMRSKIGMKQLIAIREKHVQKGNAENYHGNSISGTTAHVCLITKQFVYTANAGDSRGIAILRKSGSKYKYKALSQDHKPQLDSQKERILKAGGTISQDGRINNNLNLSRALGDFFYKNNPNLQAKNQIISAMPDITKLLDCKSATLSWDVMEFGRQRLINKCGNGFNDHFNQKTQLQDQLQRVYLHKNWEQTVNSKMDQTT